ncbi:glycosyltransferase [Rossellomorea sp. y25]|uniref:glycosyltransferase n=1 Tax=Rossellomorea sp. y25 TaxID=3118174 RepID=UPI0030E31778
MKVLHVCLASFYIDNYSYQENVLPKHHKQMGLDVEILASLVSFDKDGNSCLIKSGGSYINEYDIPVTRLDYKKSKFSKRLRQYQGTFEAIKKSKPNIIFIHGCQFYDIKYVVKYVKENPLVKVFVDNHADFSNSAKNWISKNFLHKIIWKHCAWKIEPYTTKFYGVLPARVDFLVNMYKLPEEKVELLVMGADDDEVEKAKSENSKQIIRKKYGIEKKDFLVMTGGKIDHAKKQTLLLMQAIKEINNDNIKLIVFGSVVNDLKEQVNEFCDGKRVQFIGWLENHESYKHLASADLVVFPGRHSVLWEQTVGLGKPIVVKYWEGTTHVDLGGNCNFLYEDSIDEIKLVIKELYNNNDQFLSMKEVAEQKGIHEFSYKDISKRCIQY